ncbi:MAG: hypothetical protein J0M02_10515 [Planctomycetes bacterium]|nr:hypothetical protein [Planctomycetota bacterium]
MRFRDAAHVDLGSFYARRPGLGRLYCLAGYGACLAALWWAHQPARIAALLVVLLVAWLMAWKREVGALFRAPLVAAIAMCAVLVTADRLGHPLQFRAVAAAEQPRAPRQIEIRMHGPDELSPAPQEAVK